ncbi:carboxymuconolactone decarboxylase family protein [Sphingopyxis flava]|uniref:Alkylhydroperoxidase family enzyme, contains CxxC motif n=1 Tax=Sphingopyxis flava TaxID=1507287 RepID=A0A1T5FLL7_9SPHN|nr:carboxymuconolactone decarboxylase family protein [Sphingopyxis flava]SKB97070.1 Alkylhydroperoxidase family enzyme, contains CxxC motif [Sphingopyxis flava]
MSSLRNSKTIEPRIALKTPDEMTPNERAAYEADPIAQINIGRLLSLAETLWPKMQETNIAMVTQITVPPVERELATLATIYLERGAYQIMQHNEVAKMMGISLAKVEAIAAERYGDPVFTDRERALLAFTRQVVRAVRVDDQTFAALAQYYDRRQLVELTFVIGNYMMLARMTEMAELEIDGTLGATLWHGKLHNQ